MDGSQKSINDVILSRGSHRITLIMNIILLAVVPLIIFGIIIATLSTSEMENDAAASSLTLARTLSTEIDASLAHSETVLRQAATVTINRYYHSQSQLEEFLNALIKADSTLNSIYILDKTGYHLCSAGVGAPQRIQHAWATLFSKDQR